MAISSIHLSGANVPDGKEKPVGKDSVPKVNCGGRHWAGSCRFRGGGGGGAECHSCNKVAILHGSVNGAAGSQEIQIISNHQLKKKGMAHTLFTLYMQPQAPIMVVITANKVPIHLELDTCAEVTQPFHRNQ